MFKTNAKCFCKGTIKALEKDWPVGSYLVLKIKSTVPGNRPLIAIGYKYNVSKVLSFIATEDSGSTNTGIPYLSNIPYPFSNFSICHVARPLVMTKFFGSVNEVESHNKSRQSD